LYDKSDDGFEILLLPAVFETGRQGFYPHFFELFGPWLVNGCYIAIELLQRLFDKQCFPIFGFVWVWGAPAAAPAPAADSTAVKVNA
jgi:hypothetical protein